MTNQEASKGALTGAALERYEAETAAAMVYVGMRGGGSEQYQAAMLLASLTPERREEAARILNERLPRLREQERLRAENGAKVLRGCLGAAVVAAASLALLICLWIGMAMTMM